MGLDRSQLPILERPPSLVSVRIIAVCRKGMKASSQARPKTGLYCSLITVTATEAM